MPKIKRTTFNTIEPRPLKQGQADRDPATFLSRVEQQHIRESELPGEKLRNILIRQSAVINVSTTLASGAGATINVVLTANDANIIKGFLETNIYVDNDLDRNFLWPGGNSLSAAQRAFEVHQSYNIVDSIYTLSDVTNENITQNQSQAAMSIVNTGALSRTYYVYFKWFYFIIEPRSGAATAV